MFTGFGRLGASAETVANEVVQEIRHYLRTDAPVGPYLADQLLLPLGISAWQHRTHATRGGSFRTAALTRHATTHIEILQKLLGLKIQVTQDPETNTHTVSFQ